MSLDIPTLTAIGLGVTATFSTANFVLNVVTQLRAKRGDGFKAFSEAHARVQRILDDLPQLTPDRCEFFHARLLDELELLAGHVRWKAIPLELVRREYGGFVMGWVRRYAPRIRAAHARGDGSYSELIWLAGELEKGFDITRAA